MAPFAMRLGIFFLFFLIMVSNILEGVCAVYSVKLSFADCRFARSAARYWRAVIGLHALWLKQEADIKGDCMESNSPPHMISLTIKRLVLCIL